MAEPRKMTARVGRKPIEILVLGKRDPRGPDNNISIWVDEHDQLHIKVLKAQRCYQFKKMINNSDSVEIIAD